MTPAIPHRGRFTGSRLIWTMAVGLIPILLLGSSAILFAAEEPAEPKSIRKTCGKCPEGYAMTGTTTAPEICKDGDPTLVQCVPLGANILPVCGSCPEGYAEVGNSMVPARCGSADGGRMSQCQLQKMESNLPDPNQGGVVCPPNCGETAAPGRGSLPPPPQSRPAPKKKSE
ncbi:MAG: hypothetical protein ACREJU_19840 [Nitrospiraceae bacterium]